MCGTTKEIFSRASELRGTGLDVPEITRLMLNLREMGAEVGEIPYTVTDAVDVVLKIGNLMERHIPVK
jgi:hypothetical protein